MMSWFLRKKRTIEILHHKQFSSIFSFLRHNLFPLFLLFHEVQKILKNSNADRLQAEEMIAEMKQYVFLSPLLIIQMKLLTHALPVLCPATPAKVLDFINPLFESLFDA